MFGRLSLGRASRFVFDDDRLPAAEELADRMNSYWTQFVATGDPGRGRDGALPHWSAWDASSRDAAKFMLLDTKSDGGLRMSSESLSHAGLLAQLASDDRFEGLEERCTLTRRMVGWSISERDYVSFAGGDCFAMVLAGGSLGND